MPDNNTAMDEAAKDATIELDASYKTWTTTDLIAWWFKWYGRAGHKRLRRLLVERNKK